MRYTIIFASIVLLSGCQSEFDKCMETEAPRAESTLALSDMAAAITDFKSKSSFVLKVYEAEAASQIEISNSAPGGRPVQPDYPSYGCSDLTGDEFWSCNDAHDELVEKYEEERLLAAKLLESWNARPEVVAWRETFDAVQFAAARDAGLDVASLEELERLVDSKEAELEAVNVALKARAAESDCWGTGIDSCYDPIAEELVDKFGEDLYEADWYSKYVETAKLAIAEILMTMTNKYSLATTQANELAVLTCNQNGFYE